MPAGDRCTGGVRAELYSQQAGRVWEKLPLVGRTASEVDCFQ